MLLLLLIALAQTPTYPLTVVGGSGSGVYACHAKVKISAPERRGKESFVQWDSHWDGTGIERVHTRKAVLTMPCHAVIVEARYSPKPR